MNQQRDTTASTSRPARLLVVLCACLATMLVSAASSSAGTYIVRQCDPGLGIGIHEAVWLKAGTIANNTADSVVQEGGSGCGEFGLGSRSGLEGTSLTHPSGGYGGWFFFAPNGTRFTHFGGRFGNLNNCCVSGMASYADATQNQNGGGNKAYLFQGNLGNETFGQPSALGGPVPRDWTASGWDAARVGFYNQCGPGFNCSQGPYGNVRLRGRSFVFILRDDAVPSVGEPSGGIYTGGWVRGNQSLGFSAGDTGSGLTNVTATFDNGTQMSSPSSCSVHGDAYTRFTPCPLGRSGTWTVNTAALPDGGRNVTIRATDAGGAAAQLTRAVYVDNTAPAAPSNVRVDGGEGWRPSNAFTVRWNNPGGQHAPITRVHYELCPVGGGDCTTGTRDGNGIENFDVAVPQPGAYTIKVRAQDSTGNTNPAAASAPATLRFDGQAPGRSEPAVANGWLNANDATDFPQVITLEPGAFEPASGIAGYSLTLDGSDPDGTIEVAGKSALYRIPELPEGITTLKARAISGAGVPSASVGSTLVRVDKTNPSVGTVGAPDPGAWLRTPVTLQVRGVDQPHLSGMGGSAPEDPVEAGGYVAYRFGGQLTKVRGDTATVTVPQSGRHTVVYEAVDAAGNPSGERSVSFKIDRIAPTGSFDYQDPSDPRQLSVSVADADSGVGGGQIEYRREGAGEFKDLDTTLSGSQLVARLDDVSMPDGRYEFRARVNDVAGNRANIDTRADGRAMILNLPIRLTTRLVVYGGVGVKAACAKKTRKVRVSRKRGSRRVARKTRKVCSKLKIGAGRTTIPLIYGRATASTGQVTTAQGVPIANAHVMVEGQLRTGGPFVRIGAARANDHGVFNFTIPAGASRTVRYTYDGTNTIRPAIGEVATKVRGALTLRVNRRYVLNGQSVRFRGQLRGNPVPAGGKLIVLKAKIPGVPGWKTFGTVRTDNRGRFSYPRKFQSTYGTVRYVFRAEAPTETIYSYEHGWSKTVHVVVRGS